MNFYFSVVMHEFDVITRRATFRNADSRDHCISSQVGLSANDESPREKDPFTKSLRESFTYSKVIQRASSFTIDFDRPSSPFYLVQLSGRYLGIQKYLEILRTYSLICHEVGVGSDMWKKTSYPMGRKVTDPCVASPDTLTIHLQVLLLGNPSK